MVTVDEGRVKEATRSERRAVGTKREPGIFMVNTDIYLLTKEIFNFTEGAQSIPHDLNNMLEKSKNVNALETKGA